MLAVLIVLLAVPATALLIVQNNQVQTRLAKILTRKASGLFGSELSVSQVRITFFNRIKMKEVLIRDQLGDTLIYSEEAIARIRKFDGDERFIRLSRARLNHAYVHFTTDSLRPVNIKFFADTLKSLRDTTKKKMQINIDHITLKNSRFSFENQGRPPPKNGVDFSGIVIGNMDITARGFQIHNDTVRMEIKQLNFDERSGFRLDDLRGDLRVHKTFIRLDDLRIRTGLSKIDANRLHLGYSGYHDLGKGLFPHKVKLDFSFDPSTLCSEDLAYFIPPAGEIRECISLSGDIYGPVDNLKCRSLDIGYRQNTRLAGDFDLVGLPDVQHTFMFFDVEELRTNIHDIENINLPGGTGHPEIPERLARLGNIRFNGKFTGFIVDFVTYGEFTTDQGLIYSDLSIKPDTANTIRFKGRLRTRDFDLAGLVDTSGLVNHLSMNAQINGYSGKGGALRAWLNGNISLLQFNGYDYENIRLKGNLSNKTFDGSFAVSDPNIAMEFLGKVDFEDSIPVFNFTADVSRGWLHPLNISPEIPDYFVSFLLKADFTGDNIDNLNGKISLVNSLFRKKEEQIQIYDFSLEAKHSGDSSGLVLRSDLADADIRGNYRFADLLPAVRYLMEHYLPSARFGKLSRIPAEPASLNDNRFRYRIHFKKTQDVTGFFLPELGIAQNSVVNGQFDPEKHLFSLNGDFSKFRYGSNTFEDLHIRASSDSSRFDLMLKTHELTAGGKINLDQVVLGSRILKDSIFTSLQWQNLDTTVFEGDINFSTVFYENGASPAGPETMISFHPTTLTAGNSAWKIRKSSIRIDSSSVGIRNFRIKNEQQHLAVDGKISEDPEDELSFAVNRLDLSLLNAFTSMQDISVSGLITGSGTFRDYYHNPLFFSDLRVTGFHINQEELGETAISTRWDNAANKVRLSVSSDRGNIKTLGIEGDYHPVSKNISFNVSLNKLRLDILNPFFRNQFTGVRGMASGAVNITGTSGQPLMNGQLSLQKVSLGINYLQTRYSFSNDLLIDNNRMVFSDFVILDENANQAEITGSIGSDRLKDPVLDLSLSTDRFMFMNTREGQNDSFYGTVIGSGVLRAQGSPRDVELDISMQTEQNTAFNILLNRGKEITESDFITYVNETDEETMHTGTQEKMNFSGVQMNFDLDITPEAGLQLIFDPRTGDIMKARGSGNISIGVNTSGNFEIYGDYVIREGEYNFSLQNVINKKFRVQEGGSIIWNGEPTDAELNIRTIYTTKASPYPVVIDAPEKMKRRIPVECHLIMTGKLMNPNIGFDIQLPTADQETQNLVRNSISSEEELTKQFLSLLVINNFYTSRAGILGANGSPGSRGGGMAGITTSEILSSQLSSWLSQISNDFDIGINYRPGDEITSDEMEVALSTQILNDRVSIRGNLGVGGEHPSPEPVTRSANASSIVGDFDVDVKLTESGKLRLRAFNQANDDIIFETSQYTQGVGIVYHEEFSSFKELINRYWKSLMAGKKKPRE